ncbi:hypothetical protein DVH24_036880 [Malus domestica]|uniref:F-box domain-containing protein n=1 Tax=Malus domestica TaxID=3750 RepID=A0A498IHH6_MALDO|nr:hypothetical protein DVH24_036880 [Malus domestica]
MDLQALPEGCIATVVSLTTPRDAGTLSSVSRSFRSAAESDTVWDRFLPPDIHTILSSSSPSMSVHPPHVSPSSASKTKKELYLALCDNPVLIEQGKLSFSLDRWSGKKCYMIAARALSIVWGDTPQYWEWISLPDSRFEEVAKLMCVCWLEIRGKIETRMLSPATLYKAYLVFKPTTGAYGFDQQPVEVTVGLIGEEPTKHEVFLNAQRGLGSQGPSFPLAGPLRISVFNRRYIVGVQDFQLREIKVNEAQYPKERNDGWLEIEMGEFFCEGGEGGELEMACLEVRRIHWKGGLLFQGIEIRPKRM